MNNKNNYFIILGSDHAGYDLKEILKSYLISMNYEVQDIGVHNKDSVDYPDIAESVVQLINHNPKNLGILICGSGIGMSIAANRHNFIRAALCFDPLSAQLSKFHNNANVLCLGSRIIGESLAKACVDSFLNTEFEGGDRHIRRLKKLEKHNN
ncbi:MAG: ribose 5-phosphate isomerase B [Alphaproteobacteria bacterium]|nr:ribose 5-phosphate isomerase B [Alphaproteobacteria bacterium]